MWTQVAGVMGAAAVGAGAVGAHALPKDTAQTYRTIYQTGANYHLVHSVALMTSALALKGRKRNITCALFTTGIVLFSGSCYTVTLLGERKPYSYPAPVGGFALMGAWIAVGLLP